MTDAGYDLILVGGGLANGLIAWRLASERPQLRILLLEAGAQLGGNHTWSFHDGDLNAAEHAWLSPLVGSRWPRYEVRFPELQRTLNSGYASITSDAFARVVGLALGDRVRVHAVVESLGPDWVRLSSGETLAARAVIDGRGPRPSQHLALGYQTFLGQEVRLDAPHGLTAPIIMDASVVQADGYRFVYVLPFGPDRLLIEDTHYVDDAAIADEVMRGHIASYVAAHGWTVAELVREERGSLPIVLASDFDAFWADLDGVPASGLRAGLFHPTTGYSLPHAVRLAWQVAALEHLDSAQLFSLIRSAAKTQWHEQAFFRLLNRMLFLAGRSSDRWRVMQRFYRLSEPLIQRFYAQQLRVSDKSRILVGKPPVPVLQAIRAAVATQPQDIRKYE